MKSYTLCSVLLTAVMTSTFISRLPYF